MKIVEYNNHPCYLNSVLKLYHHDLEKCKGMLKRGSPMTNSSTCVDTEEFIVSFASREHSMSLQDLKAELRESAMEVKKEKNFMKVAN